MGLTYYVNSQHPVDRGNDELMVKNMLAMLGNPVIGLDNDDVLSYGELIKQHILERAQAISSARGPKLEDLFVENEKPDMTYYVNSQHPVDRGNDELMIANMLEFVKDMRLVSMLTTDEQNLVCGVVKLHVLERTLKAHKRQKGSLRDLFEDNESSIKYYVNGSHPVDRGNDELIVANMMSYLSIPQLVSLLTDQERDLMISVIKTHNKQRLDLMTAARTVDRNSTHFK